MTISQLKNYLSSFQLSFGEQKIIWTVPTDLDHGILTTNIAFQLAKELRLNPNTISQTISDELNMWLKKIPLPGGVNKVDGSTSFKSNSFASKPIGAYINIIPTDGFYAELLTQNLDKENLITKSKTPVMLEYVSTNVAKKIHAGHMRNCNIGEALRRILSLKYSDILTDNHWGDWGVNMGVLIWGYKNYQEENKPKKPSIDQLTEYYVWANNQKEVVENWEALVRDEFLKLEQKEEFNYNFWLESIKESKNDATKDLDLLSVRPHDLNQGESFYGSDMDILTTWMQKHNIWESDGKARYFDFEKLAQSWTGLDEMTKKQISKLGRSYMISSNGYTSYCFRDVAARWQWARDHKREIMITLTDKTQNHVITQAFAIISYISQLPQFTELGDQNIKFHNLVNVAYGFLKLETGKMSSRTGNVLLLRDLFNQVQVEATKSILSKNEQKEINPPIRGCLEEVGVHSEESPVAEDKVQNILENIESTSRKLTVAALKWNDLKQSYEQDITFDINQVLNFTGNTGVYQLYTYARLNSVLKKLKIVEEGSSFQNVENKMNNNVDIKSTLQTNLNPLEQSILKQIWILPEILESICNNYQIHLLTNHLYELSNLVNKWYNDVPILSDPRREFMVTFITKVMEHLEFSLDLLGIEVVEEI
jgi:arginyl-tRNA synthetase